MISIPIETLSTSFEGIEIPAKLAIPEYGVEIDGELPGFDEGANTDWLVYIFGKERLYTIPMIIEMSVIIDIISFCFQRNKNNSNKSTSPFLLDLIFCIFFKESLI